MKIIKVVLSMLVVTTILAVSGVTAASYLAFSSITLPAFSGVYTGPTVTKTEISYQYMKKIGATDKLSGDERAVVARTISTDYGNSAWISLPKGSYATWGEVAYNMFPANYKLQMKLSTWTVTAAYFSGMWVLDESLLN